MNVPVYATASAQKMAGNLLPPGAVLENVVAAALGARRHPDRDRRRPLYLDGDVVVTVRQSPSPITGRPAWLVVHVEPRRCPNT